MVRRSQNLVTVLAKPVLESCRRVGWLHGIEVFHINLSDYITLCSREYDTVALDTESSMDL